MGRYTCVGKFSPQNSVLVTLGEKPRRGMAGPGGEQLYKKQLFFIVSSREPGSPLSLTLPLPAPSYMPELSLCPQIHG